MVDQGGRAPSESYWRGRTVCVTGGSGFLGLRLVEQLLALGARVRVIALPPPAGHPLLARAVETYFGDLRDARLVRRALAGCEVVFHAGAVVAFAGGALRTMAEVNCEGTRNVLAHAGAWARVVHTSSVVAVGPAAAGRPVSEDNPFTESATRIAYVRSKRETEELALEAAGRRDVVVTNPTFLVGPEDHRPTDLGRYCLRFWKGRAPVVMPGGVNLVDVRDAAAGHLLAAEHGVTGRRYILGGEDHTFASFARLLAAVAGFRPRALPCLPRLLLRGVAELAGGVALLRGKEPFPSRQHALLGSRYWFARSDRAAAELGYRARSVARSLAESFAWFTARDGLRLRALASWWMRRDGRLAAPIPVWDTPALPTAPEPVVRLGEAPTPHAPLAEAGRRDGRL